MAENGSAPRRTIWLVRVGALLIRLLGASWRVRRINGERFDAALTSGAPVVFTLWHGQMLPLLYQHRHQAVFVLISEHSDGEIIARIAERLGFRTIRGSTSRGASRALIALARILRAGHAVAITPDGPRGPARSFAAGALAAAQRAGAMIMPVGVGASSAWHLKSWDRFMVPKPFSRVTLAYGEATLVSGASPRAAMYEAPRFQELMAAVERDANR